jgi:vacuolar-type H+-ATPase subunit H
MESISVYLQKIEDLMTRIEDIIESSRSVPFSTKVSLDKNAVYDVIDDIRPILDDMSKDLPNEIMQAKRIISDSDKIINDARSKANLMMKNAENDIQKMTSEHEISKMANEQAAQITEEAKKSAREMRVNVMEYADEILSKCESILREALEGFSRKLREVEVHFSDTIDVLYENRQQLRK